MATSQRPGPIRRSSWLVSTVDDLWAFASMLAADGGDLLSAESVRLTTLDRMTLKSGPRTGSSWATTAAGGS